MNGLPPTEIATINTTHLRQPTTGWQEMWSKFAASTSGITQFSSHYVRPWMVLSAVTLVLPITLFAWAQPSTPTLKTAEKTQVNDFLAHNQQPANQVASAYQENSVANAAANTTDSPSATESPTSADLASSGSVLSSEEKAYRYYLTLAQGFLRRAIQTSQETATTQTNTDQQTILDSLEEALSAANTAIEIDPTNGLGFLLRARIYKTASTIKPELATRSEQDLLIAQGLGVQDVDILQEDVLDQLPTQQATNLAGGPVIADTEEGSNTTLLTETADNAQQGEVILASGQTEVFVAYPALNDTMQISVEVAPTSLSQPHTPFRVSSRKAGEGFTIQGFNSLSEDVTLLWRIVD